MFYVVNQYDEETDLKATSWKEAYKEVREMFPHFYGKLNSIIFKR